MTVSELIALLKTCPPEAIVFGWQDGNRYPIESVDPWDDDSTGSVDLNLAQDKLPENAS